MGIFVAITLSLMALVPYTVRSADAAPQKVYVAARSTRNAAAIQAVKSNNSGVDSYMAGRYQKAISEFNEAVRLNPKYIDAYSNRGAAYDAINNPERAVQDYTAAINLNPRMVEAFRNRACAYYDLGRFDQAINDWNSYIKVKPRNADALYRRGLCYQSNGDLQAALKDYDYCLKLDKSVAKASKNRDLVAKALVSGIPKGPNEVDLLKAKLTAVKPVAPDAVHERAPVQKMDPAAPFGTIGPTQRIQSTDARPLPIATLCGNVVSHIAGNTSAAIGFYQNAIGSFSAAIAANPSDHFAYFRRGNAYAASGQVDRALADYDFAIQISPSFRPAIARRDALLKQTEQGGDTK